MLDLRGYLRLWGRPVAPRGPAPAEKGATRPRGKVERWQAEALCDLLDDPRSGITRVRLVGAQPDLLETLAATAARRGLTADGEPSKAPGRGGLTLERRREDTQADW